MAISNTDLGYSKYSAYSQFDKSVTSDDLSTAVKHTGIKHKDSAGSASLFHDYDRIRDTYERTGSSTEASTDTPTKASSDSSTKTSAEAVTDYGNTIGSPKLSDTAAEYYEELKKKYSNLNFVLVSSDEKDDALSKAARFNNGSQITAVIDEEQLERMASDPEYREQMEAYIDSAIDSMDSLQDQLEEAGLSDKVAGLGIQINSDGTVSYFAVLKEMSQAERERIEEVISEKQAKAKEEKAEAQEDRIDEQQRKRLDAYREQMSAGKKLHHDTENTDDTVTDKFPVSILEASGIDELISALKEHFTEDDAISE